ncbi:hypothetical protein M2280_001175 [Prescottella agglutinans]|uniref:Uncharacterized protein n=1 Tax=Prescottella agglutinans TaxID=1644129 RepID=A0ABT6M894_9NOCA|nr:hypothetical protein [Prescottella agglutinans]
MHALRTGRKLRRLSTLQRTVTWDQGLEKGDWKNVSEATGIGIYFCCDDRQNPPIANRAGACTWAGAMTLSGTHRSS